VTDLHVTAHRGGFRDGYTPIASHEGLTLAVLRLARGTVVERVADAETAWLLMQGRLHAEVDGRDAALERASLFDESASCVHVAAGARVRFRAASDCELTVYGCPNGRAFAPRVYTPEQVPNEHRGRGHVADRSLRFVRTIFDRRNSPPEVELVLGEVVTLPGGWSSYPPHHHPQSEIYHYRFTQPQGYGHAELGDAVLKVRQFDTVLIPAGLDHAQCSAPGYGMYYSWVIRHLPDRPYTVPEFTPEHAWTMQAGAPFWWPDDVPR